MPGSGGAAKTSRISSFWFVYSTGCAFAQAGAAPGAGIGGNNRRRALKRKVFFQCCCMRLTDDGRYEKTSGRGWGGGGAFSWSSVWGWGPSCLGEGGGWFFRRIACRSGLRCAGDGRRQVFFHLSILHFFTFLAFGFQVLRRAGPGGVFSNMQGLRARAGVFCLRGVAEQAGETASVASGLRRVYFTARFRGQPHHQAGGEQDCRHSLEDMVHCQQRALALHHGCQLGGDLLGREA